MDKTRIALEALITERAGMIAENGQRMYSGQPMAYVGDNFQELADQIQSLGGQEMGGPAGLRRCDVSNVLRLVVYLVIQQRPDTASYPRTDIMGAFAAAEDGQKWIDRQHNSQEYTLEPLKVIGQGGGETQ